MYGPWLVRMGWLGSCHAGGAGAPLLDAQHRTYSLEHSKGSEVSGLVFICGIYVDPKKYVKQWSTPLNIAQKAMILNPSRGPGRHSQIRDHTFNYQNHQCCRLPRMLILQRPLE